MKTRYAGFVSIIFLMILVSSCSSYVGQTVEIGDPNVCSRYTAESPCVMENKDIRIEIEIDELAVAGTYLADGTVDLLGVANFNQMTSGTITIHLINDGVVVHSVSTSLSPGELGGAFKFGRKFKTEQKFNAITAGYQFKIQG